MWTKYIMSVHLLRHCESIFNRYNIDDIDCGLTEFGKEQAAKICGEYDIVVCSPLKRCLETLQYSSIKTKKPIISAQVREYKKDKCDFLDGEEIVFETDADVKKRVEKVRKMIMDLKKQFKRILIVTHADFIWHLTARKDKETGEMFGQRADNGDIIEMSI
jgi:broad specificity phosphatase PhoE